MSHRLHHQMKRKWQCKRPNLSSEATKQPFTFEKIWHDYLILMEFGCPFSLLKSSWSTAGCLAWRSSSSKYGGKIDPVIVRRWFHRGLPNAVLCCPKISTALTQDYMVSWRACRCHVIPPVSAVKSCQNDMEFGFKRCAKRLVSGFSFSCRPYAYVLSGASAPRQIYGGW